MGWSGYNPMASISRKVLWICNNENTLNRGYKCPRPQPSTQEKCFFGQPSLEKDGNGIEIKHPKLIILQGKGRVSCQPQSWGCEVGQDSIYSCGCRWIGERLILCSVHWFAFDEWHTNNHNQEKKKEEETATTTKLIGCHKEGNTGTITKSLLFQKKQGTITGETSNSPIGKMPAAIGPSTFPRLYS